MSEPLKLLVIEDVASDFLLLERHLRDGLSAVCRRVETTDELSAALSVGGWDAVLSDYNVPGMDFRQTLEQVHALAPDLPVILVSGTVGEEEAVELLKLGLSDFVLKDRLARLPSSIQRTQVEASGRRARKEAERALRESEERYRRIVETATEGIWSVDVNLRTTFVNEAFARMLGYEPAEMLGAPAQQFTFAEDLEEFRKHMSTRREGISEHYERRFRRKDGDECWCLVSGTPIRDSYGQFAGSFGMLTDITQRKRVEEELSKNEAYFRSLIENTLDVIAVVAPDGAVRYVSPSIERLLGYDPTRLRDLNVFDLIHPDDLAQAKARFQSTLETGTRFEQVELRVRHADGSWRTLSMIGKPSPPETGTRGLVINARDLTERQQLETQLRVSQKMEGIGRLAGGIAHDFNNLLTAILGYSELMDAQLPDDQDLRSSLREIRLAGERATSLTRQLLAFSRRQVLQPKVLDLNAVVSEVEKLLRRLIGEDVKLVIQLDPRLGSIKADPGQLEQVLMNLAVNARDAMPEGGTLTIGTANTFLDSRFAAGHPGARSGEYAALTVVDTGIGMSEEVRGHAFEPFFTTKEQGKGTGLGLATAYGIVKQSDGYITLESEPGRGTTFRIYLPCTAGAAEALEVGGRTSPSPRGTETILLVEDEPGVRHLAHAILEAQGYVVLQAASGDEALEVARSNAGEIQLVVTDVIMPGMSGRVLWDQMRPLRPASRVLFMSGYTDDTIMRHGVLAAGIAFLQKPLTPQSLAKKVREVLDN